MSSELIVPASKRMKTEDETYLFKAKPIILTEEERADVQNRLYARSEVDVDSGCRLWKGSVMQGYGQTSWKYKQYRVHRLAYAAYHGHLPSHNDNGEQLFVRHHPSCKNRHCFASEHLTIGTSVDNMRDKVLAGTHSRGERNGSATITEEIARQIIASRYPKEDPNYKTQRERASLFGVDLCIVTSIDCGKNWKHLERPVFEKPQPKQIRQTRNTKQHCNALLDEATVIAIIASRKHRHDPAYETQEQRAKRFKTNKHTVNAIDGGHSWQYLERPPLQVFPKPKFEWSHERITEAYERVKERCQQNHEPNKFVGTPCLVWQGNLSQGRPSIRVFGTRQRPAYHYAVSYKTGRMIGPGELVRHLCGEETCCNPEHVAIGSIKENSIDTVLHGTNPRQKLTPEKVREIRAKSQTCSRKDLAIAYGVSRQTITDILNGKRWAHVKD